jgi:Ni/Fe-hydrogenase subunit HybB-like protein
MGQRRRRTSERYETASDSRVLIFLILISSEAYYCEKVAPLLVTWATLMKRSLKIIQYPTPSDKFFRGLSTIMKKLFRGLSILFGAFPQFHRRVANNS